MTPQKIRKKLKAFLSDDERYRHCLEVERTAVKLAKVHGVSVRKAFLAGLLHDCAKSLKAETLLKDAKKMRFRIDPFLRKQPKLLHGLISAYYAKKYFGVNDKEVLLSIQNHTSGRAGMTKLEKIIFIADHTEPGRKYRHMGHIRRMARLDLEKTIVLIATEMIQYLLKRKLPIYYRTVVTRNYYLK